MKRANVGSESAAKWVSWPHSYHPIAAAGLGKPSAAGMHAEIFLHLHDIVHDTTSAVASSYKMIPYGVWTGSTRRVQYSNPITFQMKR